MKLLVALDDSTFARNALQKALQLAKAEPSELLLLSVVPVVGAVDEMSPRMTDKLKRDADSLLKVAAAQAKQADVPSQAFLEQGISPANSIITLAQEQGVDTIVIGHRGKSNLEKFLVGSVALQVVAHASCSVLVVK